MMLTAARGLRQEREKKKELATQSGDMKTAIQLAEQRISRLQTQLKEIRKAGIGTTPEGTYSVTYLYCTILIITHFTIGQIFHNSFFEQYTVWEYF